MSRLAPSRRRVHLFAFFLPLRREHGAVSGECDSVHAGRSTSRASLRFLVRRQLRASAGCEHHGRRPTSVIANVHLENPVAMVEALFSDTARGRQARRCFRSCRNRTWCAWRRYEYVVRTARTRVARECCGGSPIQRFDRLQPTFANRLVLDHLLFELTRWLDGQPAGAAGELRVRPPSVVAIVMAGPVRTTD
jgi:hypothetical protein